MLLSVTKSGGWLGSGRRIARLVFAVADFAFAFAVVAFFAGAFCGFVCFADGFFAVAFLATVVFFEDVFFFVAIVLLLCYPSDSCYPADSAVLQIAFIFSDLESLKAKNRA
jgi:hypothetical protein